MVQPWVCLQFSAGGSCDITLGMSTVLCWGLLGTTLGMSTVLCLGVLLYNLGYVYSSMPERIVIQPRVCLQFSAGGSCDTTLGVSTVLCRT